MVKRSLIAVLALLCIVLFPSFGAENPVVEMQLFSVFSYSPQNKTLFEHVVPSLSISLKSPNSGNVRGEVVLKSPNPFTLDATAVYEEIIHKAYFRARFPSFRLTAGKTRLSWGDGMLFNAADVLYGSSDTSVNLTQAELRGETGWMSSINYPLGFFSFAEVVILPSDDNSPQNMGFGARLYTTVGETKMEGGYLSKLENNTRVHKPYVSLQGNVGPDWYLASSLTIPQSGNIAKETFDSWMISGGLFHIQYLEADKNLSLRLEFLTRPAGNWKFEGQDDADCPLLLYPEIVYAPNSSLSWSLRSIISPLDFSANLTVGAIWSVFEGFSLVGNLSSAFGESGDLFKFRDQKSFVSLTLGASWIF